MGDNLRTAELAEIVENLHRKDLGAIERAEAIARFDKIAAAMNAELEAAKKEAEAKTSEISETIAPRRKHRATGVGRGANQKKGPRKGSGRDIAKQFGLDEGTVRKDNKRKADEAAAIDAEGYNSEFSEKIPSSKATRQYDKKNLTRFNLFRLRFVRCKCAS